MPDHPDETVEESLFREGHPVTRVFCDSDGIICYERDGAPSIRLGSTPKMSRKTALNRCLSMLQYCDKNCDFPGDFNPERNFPISLVGTMTYNELKTQTAAACIKSKQIVGEKRERRRKRRR